VIKDKAECANYEQRSGSEKTRSGVEKKKIDGSRRLLAQDKTHIKILNLKTEDRNAGKKNKKKWVSYVYWTVHHLDS